MDPTSHLRSLTLSKQLSQPPQQIKINKANVQNLVESFLKLNHNEKLLFLVSINQSPQQQQPSQPPEEKPDKQPMETRLLLTQTWLLKTFTPDPLTALPKEEVYDHYMRQFPHKPISTADFGKLVRQVFPSVKARRLGQRGASRYCFANIRKRSEFDIEKPHLPQKSPSIHEDYLQWAKSNFGMEFPDIETLLNYLKCNNFKNVARKRRSSSFCTKKKEDAEVKKYFEDEWPQLRNLLSDKKRHCSNVVKSSQSAEVQSRSASVPIFEKKSSSRSDSGYDSVNSSTPILENFMNPLLNVEENVFDSVFDLMVEDVSGENGAWLDM